ncbi:MAG: CBS domain-containing protein [Candidatus Thalassarchaeaceae archaeon]|jgi:predicted transcriptional regulator|nr:CBS domain-containing protein [Candidatus Thalassarchaeaceae archaeon]
MGILPKKRIDSKLRQQSSSRSQAARNLRCSEVMEEPRIIKATSSVSMVIHHVTENEWDHVFLIDENKLPVGRIHAVDLLKMVDLKRVNRDMVWAEAIPATQCVSQPPLSVKENTPLLKATVLMLTHDLNQLAVVDFEGAIVGTITPSIVARHLPRYIL